MPAALSVAGPHACVSPALYRFTSAAPTWNYTAAQVRGVIDKIESAEEQSGETRDRVSHRFAQEGSGRQREIAQREIAE